MTDRALRMFTRVYLTTFKELNPEQLTLTHIQRMEHIAFDAEMSKFILSAIEDDKPLKVKYLTSLAYTKFINKKTALTGPEVDLIELANIIMDHSQLVRSESAFMQDYISALYFTVLLHFPSLFFFRSRHLFETLHFMAHDEIYLKEKNFWQKSEDLILRTKGQLSTQQLAQVVDIYSGVPVSQVFWNEMEKVILSNSADFRGHKTMILQVVSAFANRSKETFWKVFSVQIIAVSDQLTFDEFIQVLDVLDYSNGETLFDTFVKKFFIDEQFRFRDDLDQVLALARIFIKQRVSPPVGDFKSDQHPVLLSELLSIMMKYLTLQLSLLETQSQEASQEIKIRKVIQIASIIQSLELRDDWADYARLKKDLKSTMTRVLAAIDSTSAEPELQAQTDALELLKHEMFTSVALAKTVNHELQARYENKLSKRESKAPQRRRFKDLVDAQADCKTQPVLDTVKPS